MNRSLVSAVALLCLAAPALADPILVNGLLPDALIFTPEPGDVLQIEAPTPFSGLATHGPGSGVATFGTIPPFLTQPLTGITFPIVPPASESFTYFGSDGTLSLNILWSQLINGGEEMLSGTGTVTATTLPDFALSSTTPVTGNFPTTCQLANFGGPPCDIFAMSVGKFEGGGVGDASIPDSPGTVPEPSTIALLGAALLGLASWRYALRTVT